MVKSVRKSVKEKGKVRRKGFFFVLNVATTLNKIVFHSKLDRIGYMHNACTATFAVSLCLYLGFLLILSLSRTFPFSICASFPEMEMFLS